MPMPAVRAWNGLAWSGSLFCTVAQATAVAATSPDGFSWIERTLPADLDWVDVAFNGTVLCAIAGGTSGGSNKCATSSDGGLTWTERTLPQTAGWKRICASNGTFIAIAHDVSGSTTDVAATSTDNGATWTARTLPSEQNWTALASDGTTVVALSAYSGTGAMAYSTNDGASWSAGSMPSDDTWIDLTVTSSGFIAVAIGSTAGAFSAAGTSWSAITLPGARSWIRVGWNGASVIAVASGAADYYAQGNANGSSWSESTLPDTANGYNCLGVGGDGRFVAIGFISDVSAVSLDNGDTWSTVAPTESGDAVAYTELTVYETGAAIGYTELTVDYPSGAASAATELTVTGEGAAVAATALAVISPAHQPLWRARCLLDGVDVSARLVGQASVEAEEGAARIAQVVLQPPSGLIEPLDYVGKTISLDYVLVIGGVDVPRRVFTGLVDTPSYDPSTTLLALDCVDDLQNRVAMLDRTTIDSLVGGMYSEAVQGEIDDNWDYAQALLSTVPASLDASAAGGMRVTEWDLADVWATYDEGDLIYAQASLTLPQRSTLTNQVDIEFAYRYPRLRQRYTSIGWSGTRADMLKVGYAYPKQQDIAGAAGGSGWQVVTSVFWPAPAAIPYSGGGFIYPDPGSIDMAVLFMAQRHAQTVTESYAITVSAPESITLNGTLPASLRGALASEFDGRNWESALDIEPLLTSGDEQDYAPDAPRADADHAIETLLAQARTRILGSHRGARVRNAVLCNPDLDLDKRIEIDTASMAAEGKVARVVHRLDFDAGSAVTEFDLAIFGAGGAGIITPDTLDPPAAPDEAAATHVWQADLPSLTVSVYGSTTYTDDLMGLLLNPPETITVEDVPGEGTVTYDNPYYVAGDGYPVTGFRVRMPGVDDADRDPIDKPVSQSYSIIIPGDTLTFTVP